MYLLLVKLVLFFIHDFFVSVSYIEYDDQRNAIEAHKKIFFDDFEKTLKKQFLNEDFDILKSNQILVDDYIRDYLTNNIEFVINDKKYDFEYLGHEYEDGIINCYFEINKIKNDLSQNFGSDVKLNYNYDPDLIGGLIIQVESLMIDTSIKNKLQQIEKKMIEA